MKISTLFIIFALLAANLFGDTNWYPEGQIDYFRFRANIFDLKGTPVHGWRINVDNNIFIYSGPPIPEHVCTPEDFWKKTIYVWVAPPYSDQTAIEKPPTTPRDLGITISRITGPTFKARFLVTSGMWADGSWETPKLVSVDKDNKASLSFSIRLERANKTAHSP